MSDHYISVFNGASHLKSCDFGEEPFVGVSVVAYLPQIINSLNIMLGTIAFDEDMDFQGLFTAGGCFIAPAKKRRGAYFYRTALAAGTVPQLPYAY